MKRELAIYCANRLVGILLQNEYGRLLFTYAEEWLGCPDAFPLSQILPLRSEPFAKECHAYFGGLLPEEQKREMVARIFGISSRNDFSMIERIGGECPSNASSWCERPPVRRCQMSVRCLMR